MDSSAESNNQKKDPFENLPRDELQKKCKQFLGIAQKAKQAKDELNEENKELKQKLHNLETKSANDTKAMQEMLNVLTQQKLQLVTDNDSLKKHTISLENQLKDYVEIGGQVQTLEIENQSYTRQVKRLTDENEQLISHLEILERQISELNQIGEKQREQLLSLEKHQDQSKFATNSTQDTEEIIKQLEIKCNHSEIELENNKALITEKALLITHLTEELDNLKAKTEQIVQLKEYCQLKNDEIFHLNQTHADLIKDLNFNINEKSTTIQSLETELDNTRELLRETENKYKTIFDELQTTKQSKETYNDKLKTYHSKLIKVYTDIKELKQQKHNLIVILENYSKYINQWQNEIRTVLDNYHTELNNNKTKFIELQQLYDNFEKTNFDLHEKITSLENLNASLLTEKEKLTQNTSILINKEQNEENISLLNTIKTLEDQINTLNLQKDELNINLKDTTENYQEKITEFQQEIKSLNSDKENLIQDISIRKNDLQVLNEENTKLLNAIKILEDQINAFNLQTEQLNLKHTNLEDTIKNYQEKTSELELQVQSLTSDKENLIKDLSVLNNKEQNQIKVINEENMKLLNEIKTVKDQINTVNLEKEELNSRNKNFEDTIKNYQEKTSDLELQIQSLTSDKENLIKDLSVLNNKEQNQIQVINEENMKLLNEIKTVKDQINTVNLEKDELNSRNKHFEDTIKKSQENLLELEEQIKTLNSEKETISLTYQKQTQELINTIEENLKLDLNLEEDFKIKLDKIKTNLKTKSDIPENKPITHIQTLICNFLNTIQSEYEKTVQIEEQTINDRQELTNTLTTLQNDLSTYKRDCLELQNQLMISKRENADLLKEMNDMNEALKERGETISKLQEYVQELIRKVKTLEQESAVSKEEKDKLEVEIKTLSTKNQEDTISSDHNAILNEKEEKIKSLEQELLNVKESLSTSINSQDVADSETMSTSTVSRLDEASRFKDLEGTWEERYTKLRTLAVKLKGKVKELTEQLSQERTEKTEIQSKLTTTTRNLQSVQTEFDKFQDQYEIITKETKTTNKQVESLMKSNNNLKRDLKTSAEIVTKLQNEIERLKKEKTDSNSAIKQLTNQINQLKKEIDNGLATKKDLETKIVKIENTVKAKEDELQKEIKSHKQTRDQLQQLEKEVKKKSVLSLEMENYERSLKDLSQKLEKKNDKINKLELKIISQNNATASLKEQNKILEEKYSSTETNYNESVTKYNEIKSKLSESDALIAQKDGSIKDLIKKLEIFKTTNEDLSSELAQTVTQNQKQIDLLKTDRDYLKGQILGLEEKTRELTKNLTDREQELAHIQAEFSSYKVRAQSVLRQNQTRDVAFEEKLTDEVTELKQEVETLTVKLNDTQSQFRSLKTAYETLEKEKSHLLVQFDDLEKALTKEKDDNKILIERQQQLVTEHREAMRAQKVHVDTLAQCYRQQLAEQEERHTKAISELQATQHSQLQPKDDIDISSMRREDGEGSESVESNSNNLHSKLVPLSLDKLLKMDADSFTTRDSEEELALCKKQLVEYEARVKHLIELLADAEQDLAKHSQLNQLLKEEIRRHQRSIEREKHVENLEYMKNVIFKFLTLANGDEKSHLVPVLNTILRLSPEETQKLNAVAKGDLSTRGWGSYLWNSSTN